MIPRASLLIVMLLAGASRAADRGTLDLRRQLLEADSERDALELEERLGKPGPAEQQRVELAEAAPKLNHIADRLQASHRVRMEALDALLREVRAERDAALQLWQETSETVLDLEAERERYEDEAARASAGRTLLDLPMILTYLGGGVLLLVAVGMVLHERRTELRRWLRRSSSLALLLLLPALATGDAPEVDRLRRVNEEIAAIKKRVDAQKAAHLDAWANLLAPAEGGTAHARKLRGWEEEAMGRTRAVLVAIYTSRWAADETDRLLVDAQRLRDDLSKTSFLAKLSATGHVVLRVALCVLLAVCPLLVLGWARRSQRRRLAERERTCPRCLARDTLVLRNSPRDDPLYPDPRHVECSRCRHEFPERQRRLHHLCFPAVGIRSSGKTRWLGTLGVQVMNAQVPTKAALHAAPLPVEQAAFAEILRQIVDAEHTDPTAHDVFLPAPLTLHLEDHDSWGRSQALVDLFDFSGELMERTMDVDQLRRRALLMDGFILFLDPSQVRGGLLEQQRDAIRRFHDDLRDMHKLGPGESLRTPVAVCLSRLDLLPTESPFGPVAEDWLTRLQQTAGGPVTRARLWERSQLCEEALPFMFQGWDVARELRERFGSGLLFFPLSSLGLEEAGPGGFEPFGLFEPLLWLLHRQGYSVLEM